MTRSGPRGPSTTDRLVRLLAGRPYRVVGYLGRGGMGEVWAIEHVRLKRQFALKVSHARQARAADRMRVEAEALGHISHPNVVEVIDFWTADDGTACVIMELLQGCSLWQELSERVTLPVAEAADLACQALSGLGAAHASGIVHRDIKPENLFLHRPAGVSRVLKVVDFGMVRVVPGRSSRAPRPVEIRTGTGVRVGSPLYMSPEARRGEGVDARSDLFSLGLVLYYMITGAPPLAETTDIVLPLRLLGAAVPAELAEVILRAIRPLASDRFQSAEEFLQALAPFARPFRTPETNG